MRDRNPLQCQLEVSEENLRYVGSICLNAPIARLPNPVNDIVCQRLAKIVPLPTSSGYPRRSTHCLQFGPMNEAPFKSICKRVRITHRNDEPVFTITYQIGRSCTGSGYNRQPVSKGFGDHHSKAITKCRKYQHVGSSISFKESLLRNG